MIKKQIDIEKLKIKLQDSNPEVWRQAAGVVADNNIQECFDTIIHCLLKADDYYECGSYLYALRVLDCSTIFELLFDISLKGNYECKSHAIDIMWDNGFYVSDKIIENAIAKLEIWKENNDLTLIENIELVHDLNIILNDLKG